MKSCTFLNKINLTNDMQDLPVMDWIPKMSKCPISFCFIMASPVCGTKPFLKDAT